MAEVQPLLTPRRAATYTALTESIKEATPQARVLGVVAVTTFIYLNVSGGPYASETMLQSAGPLYTILAFLILPFLWGYPMGYLAAELASAFPTDSSQTAWAQLAFGDMWAFTASFAGFVGGVIDMTIFPNVLVSYLSIAFGYEASPLRDYAIKASVIIVLSLLNAAGLRIVGTTSVVGSVIMLLPFLFITIACVPKVNPQVWLETTPTFDLAMFLNAALWNLTGWESVSALAGSIKKPERTFPMSLFACSILVAVTNILPIMAMSGVDSNWALYDNGHYVDVANQVGGSFLKISLAFGALVFCVLMYCYRMAIYSYQMEGMAEMGLLPSFLRYRTKSDLLGFLGVSNKVEPDEKSPLVDAEGEVPGAPIVAIAVVTLMSLALSPFEFGTILKLDNVLYCTLHLSEVACFIALRIYFPDVPRPFKVPLGTIGSTIFLLPTIILAFVLILSSGAVTLVCASLVMAFGATLFFLWKRSTTETS